MAQRKNSREGSLSANQFEETRDSCYEELPTAFFTHGPRSSDLTTSNTVKFLEKSNCLRISSLFIIILHDKLLVSARFLGIEIN